MGKIANLVLALTWQLFADGKNQVGWLGTILKHFLSSTFSIFRET
jgi:hypothetical protein